MSETGRTPEGIDADGVTAWFAGHVPAAAPPLRFDLIAGGHSNLTYAVTDARGRRWAGPPSSALAIIRSLGPSRRGNRL